MADARETAENEKDWCLPTFIGKGRYRSHYGSLQGWRYKRGNRINHGKQTAGVIQPHLGEIGVRSSPLPHKKGIKELKESTS